MSSAPAEPEAVRVALGDRSYTVHIGSGSLEAMAGDLARHARLGLVADERVAALHGNAALERLGGAEAVAARVELPAGEPAKTPGHVEDACRALVRAGLDRGDAVVALGGGAATDVAGFCAACLFRGVAWYAVPTSLLGMVDASVGGKTGVNLPEGKNLLGAFHQPSGVACDPGLLATLDPREFRSGLAEVVKTAWIGDADLFRSLERDPPRDASFPGLAGIIRRCIVVKAEIVSRDEREGGLRAVLNFGHTLGHAIETEGRGRWKHGEAVALGMLAAVRISAAEGWCAPDLADRLESLLKALGLPVRWPELDPDAVLARTAVDKKRSGRGLAWQLTRGLGLVSVARNLPEQAPRASLEFLRS